jgi:ABC-type multidrug transport system fused ATPase/permease subunit
MVDVLSGIGSLSLPVVAFYLILLCNFIKETAGCPLQNALNNSMIAKHMVGLILLFFLVVYTNPEYADKHIVRNIAITLAIYAWFWITSRTHLYIILPVLLLLVASYILSISRKRHESEKNEKVAKRAKTWQNALALTALILSVLGALFYLFEKRREYKEDFLWYRFLAGNMECRNYTQPSAQLLRTDMLQKLRLKS